MSTQLSELCQILIEDTYGRFYAHIFSVLLTHGRTIAPQLAKKCQLPQRQVLYGLAVLGQAGLIYHYTTVEGRTSYEANAENAYWLVRSGKVVDVVRKRYGDIAAAAMSQLLLLGHASIELLTASSRIYHLATRSSHKTSNGEEDNVYPRNAVSGLDGLDEEVDSAIRTLIRHGLICRLRKAHFHTEADNHQLAENTLQVRASISVLKGTKAKEEFDAKLRAVLVKQNKASISPGPNSDTPLSRKRKIDAQDEGIPHTKKSRLNDWSPTQEGPVVLASFPDDEDDALCDGLVVRVNYSSIVILCRNSSLASMVASTYGNQISRTYTQVLKQLEAGATGIPTDLSSPSDSQETLHTVHEDQLAHDLAACAVDARDPGWRLRSSNGHVNGFAHTLTIQAQSHLDILCEPPFNFLSRSSDYPDKYVVRCSATCTSLRNAEILRIIAARFDKHAIRIVRALVDKGKIDEKHLQEIVLLSVKELRKILARLQQAGFVELQEVPREAQRQPSRTMYLWFYDPERVRRMLTADTYKCMARCLQRMKVEGGKVRATIEKSERSDISGQEEKMLAKAELEALKAWRKKEARLLGELGRLDELVFVLRDF